MSATLAGETIASELDLELVRARALARRRICWLRARWPTSGAFAGLAVGHEEADRLVAGDAHHHIGEFLERDPAAIVAGEELAAADRALDELAAAAAAPLAELSVGLGLSVAEHDLLALAVCAEVDPGFARLCAYLADDATRPHLTPRLACDLLAPGDGTTPPLAAALAPRGRLRSLDLLRLDGAGAWGGRALRVDERVLAVIAGDVGPDRRLLPALEPLLASELPTRLAEAALRAAELSVAAAGRGRPRCWRSPASPPCRCGPSQPRRRRVSV